MIGPGWPSARHPDWTGEPPDLSIFLQIPAGQTTPPGVALGHQGCPISTLKKVERLEPLEPLALTVGDTPCPVVPPRALRPPPLPAATRPNRARHDWIACKCFLA